MNKNIPVGKFIFKNIGIALGYGLLCIAVLLLYFIADDGTNSYRSYGYLVAKSLKGGGGGTIVNFLLAGLIACGLGLAAMNSKRFLWGLCGGLVGAGIFSLIIENSKDYFAGFEKLLYFPNHQYATSKWPVFSIIWILVGIGIIWSMRTKRLLLYRLTVSTIVSGVMTFLFMLLARPLARILLVSVFSRDNSSGNLIIIVLITGTITFFVGFLPFLLVLRYDNFVKLEAVKSMDDPAALVEVVQNEQNQYTLRSRNIAVEKIKDQKILADLVKKIDNSDLLMIVVSKLEDPKVLEDIAQDHQSQYIQQYAENRLRELAAAQDAQNT
jgi:hypothetical protein